MFEPPLPVLTPSNLKPSATALPNNDIDNKHDSKRRRDNDPLQCDEFMTLEHGVGAPTSNISESNNKKQKRLKMQGENIYKVFWIW